MIKTKTKLYNISSKDSQNGSYKSLVKINLPDLAYHNDSIRNVSFSVEHCEVPNSFYIVNYSNNILVIDSVFYSIPVGNYNVRTFISYMATVLPSITITYDSINNKLIFTRASSITINASISTINKIIGLDTNDITNTIIEMPYVVNFLPIPRINFKCSSLNLNNYNYNDGSSDLFLSLQNNTGQLMTINYINQTQLEFTLETRTLSELTIFVMDDNNNYINFNNINWCMTLLFKIQYVDNTPQNTFSSIINNL